MIQTVSLGRYGAESVIVDCKTEICGIPFQMKFDISRPSQRFIYECITKFGAYEPESVLAIKRHLKPGDTFFDVGAHVGYFTRLALNLVGEEGGVFSFEPYISNFYCLESNCPEQNCYKFPEVIGEKMGAVDFYTNPDNDGGNSLWCPANHPWNEKSKTAQWDKVGLRRFQYDLDYFSTSSYPPKAIKIDTEGAEVRVLKGATRILKSENLKLVICELNRFGLKQLGDSESDIYSILKDFGFRCSLDSLSAICSVPLSSPVSNLIFERP